MRHPVIFFSIFLLHQYTRFIPSCRFSLRKYCLSCCISLIEFYFSAIFPLLPTFPTLVFFYLIRRFVLHFFFFISKIFLKIKYLSYTYFIAPAIYMFGDNHWLDLYFHSSTIDKMNKNEHKQVFTVRKIHFVNKERGTDRNYAWQFSERQAEV